MSKFYSALNFHHFCFADQPILAKYRNRLFLKIETREEIMMYIFSILLHPRSQKQKAKWKIPCTLLDDFLNFAWFSQRQPLKNLQQFSGIFVFDRIDLILC